MKIKARRWEARGRKIDGEWFGIAQKQGGYARDVMGEPLYKWNIGFSDTLGTELRDVTMEKEECLLSIIKSPSVVKYLASDKCIVS